MKQFDLLNHPIRLRIVLALHGRQLTTTQVSAVLKDVPKASLYRHISRLLQGGVLEVVETHLVRGIEERTLTAVRSELELSSKDVETQLNVDEFADFVRTYGTLVTNDMADVVASSSHIETDQLLFRDYDFAVTDEEFAILRAKIWKLLDEAESLPLTGERQTRRLLILSYPNLNVFSE